MNQNTVQDKLWLRLLGYFIFQALVVGAYTKLIDRAAHGELGSLDLDRVLKEDELLEFLQIVVLIVVSSFCWSSFRRGRPPLHRLLALLALVAVFRELDAFLRDLLFDGAHYRGMLFFMMLAAATIISGREELRRELPAFLLRPGFYFMLFGLTLVAVYAQFFGQRDLWKILAEDRTSQAKRFVEEGLEFLGYVTIGCGVFEERFFGKRALEKSNRRLGSSS